MAGSDSIGVVTLIRNEDATENKFRMLGSINIGDTFIEIVPIITNEQQGGSNSISFDSAENTHLVEWNDNHEFTWAAPIVPGKSGIFRAFFFQEQLLTELNCSQLTMLRPQQRQTRVQGKFLVI